METQASRQQQIAMLKILYGACSAALDAFHAADNPIDGELVVDLEKMVERTRVELERVDCRRRALAVRRTLPANATLHVYVS
jgi:hypothetical protein